MPEALTTSRLWQRPARSSQTKALTGFYGGGQRWALPLSPTRRHQEPPNSRSAQELPRISEHIRVCVRIRPLSGDEATDGELPSIVPGPQGSGLLKLLLLELQSTRQGENELRSHSNLVRSWPRTWEFDWVISGRGTQASVYNLFGQHLVQSAVEGLHGCIIACGPCGSGKSHTIFGGRQQEQQGLVPRLAEGIFRMLRAKNEKHIVKFSYLELYNERLVDLLLPQRRSPPFLRHPPLEVRQHPRVGVFVGNLSWSVVSSVSDVLRLLDFGHKMRAVGCTNANAASSRSHGVATFQLEQLVGREEPKRRWAQLQTVDLAGAARMDQIGDSQVRQKESRLINTSLLTLSLVIKRLSAQDQHSLTPGRGHIGCRDNKLTFLLSDSLLGNCRTVMCACVSPASSAVADTESALRFAANCRKVFTHPMRNEEPKNETASALRRELDQLARELAKLQSMEVRRELSDRLQTAQLLCEQHGSWEDQEARSKEMELERHTFLNSLGLGAGLSKAASTSSLKTARGTQTSKKFPTPGHAERPRGDEEPCLVNICEDPLLSGCLRYSLPANRIVHVGSSSSCQVHVDGLGIKPEMCSVVWRPGYDVEVEVESHEGPQRPTGALYKMGPPKVLINGQAISGVAYLRTQDVLQVGHGHMFQLLCQPSRPVSRPPREGPCLDAGVVEDLEAEFGLDSASCCVAVLQELQPLLDEATHLTEELKGERLAFQGEVLHQSASERSMEPEIVVTVRSEGRDARGGSLLAVWSVEKFKERLEAFRDLYHEVSERGAPWTELDGNPWEEKSPENEEKRHADKATSSPPSPASAFTELPLEQESSFEQTASSPLRDLRPSTPRDLSQDRGTSMTPPLPVTPREPLTPTLRAAPAPVIAPMVPLVRQAPVPAAQAPCKVPMTGDAILSVPPANSRPAADDSQLHRAVRGMPEIADRLTQRWARRSDRGFQTLMEYKDLAQHLAEDATLPRKLPDARLTPPRGGDKAQPKSRPSSAKGREERPKRSDWAPGAHTAQRAERTAERRGALAREELSRRQKPEREEVARLASPAREARPAKAESKADLKAEKRLAKAREMPADLFEIPEQLREARRRTSELEAQLSELRKRLQLQENRSASMVAPPAVARQDTVYVGSRALEGFKTPGRCSLPPQVAQAQVAPRLETRSLSPPPQAFTWPVYAAPRVASPPRAVSPVTYVTQRVASPVRFIQQAPGQVASPTYWFPRTVSPQPMRQPPWLVADLTKESGSRPDTALYEPTSSI